MSKKTNKLLYGRGFYDGDYSPQTEIKVNGNRVVVWRCPYYARWADMLKRCYSNKFLLSRPTYAGCTVCEEWLTFSNFKSWMEKQGWEGKQLDKDILGFGNNVYSPETCIFVSNMVNSFFGIAGSKKFKTAIGAFLDARRNKIYAQIRNPINGSKEFLGYYQTELEAHLAWKRRKHELACLLAEKETDQRIIHALTTRYAGDDIYEA